MEKLFVQILLLDNSANIDQQLCYKFKIVHIQDKYEWYIV